MMVRIWIAVCLLCWTSSAWQDPETKPATPPTTPPTTEPKTPPKAVGKTPPKGSPKAAVKNVPATPRKPAPAVPANEPAPVPVTVQAASKALDALAAAIRASAEGSSRPEVDASTGKLKDLQARLHANGDAMAIAREAAQLMVKVYDPNPKAPEAQPPAPAPAPEPRRSFDYVWVLVLVSLVSPLICVAGFWLGSRTVENNLRKSLREAGLL